MEYYTLNYIDQSINPPNNVTFMLNEFTFKRQNAFYKSFAMHRKNSIFYPIELYLSYYTILLIIVGTICNLISFITMNLRRLRKYTCMKILSFLSLVDALVLYQWNLNTFFKYNLSTPPMYQDLEEISIFWCRWISFLAFFSLQLSSWLLSLVSLDRVLVVYSFKWRLFTNKPNRIYLLITGLVSVIFTLNSHIIFLNGFKNETIVSSQKMNATLEQKSVICYQKKNDKNYIFPKWETVHLLVYNAIPFTIMLICNSLIIYNIKFARRVQSKTKSSCKKKRRMTVMLILVTFSFMLLTLPSVIVHTFLREFLSNKPYRRLVNMIVNNLLHTSHAINFFVHIFGAQF